MIYDTKDKKLISGAAPFFEANQQLKEMYASEDGQYFYTVSASNYHCKQRGLKLFRITRAQIPKPEEKPEAVKTEPAKIPAAHEPAKPELKTEAKKVPPPKKKAGRPTGKPAGKTGENAKTTK